MCMYSVKTPPCLRELNKKLCKHVRLSLRMTIIHLAFTNGREENFDTGSYKRYLSDGIYKFPDSHGRPPLTTLFIVRCIFSSMIKVMRRDHSKTRRDLIFLRNRLHVQRTLTLKTVLDLNLPLTWRKTLDLRWPRPRPSRWNLSHTANNCKQPPFYDFYPPHSTIGSICATFLLVVIGYLLNI